MCRAFQHLAVNDVQGAEQFRAPIMRRLPGGYIGVTTVADAMDFSAWFVVRGLYMETDGGR